VPRVDCPTAPLPATCRRAGLWLYGFRVMRALGNQITYHSPSRGYSMELGATMTVLAASKLGIPVSSTMCITGATVVSAGGGVMLCCVVGWAGGVGGLRRVPAAAVAPFHVAV
jgi:phosphate/sulfate permease